MSDEFIRRVERLKRALLLALPLSMVLFTLEWVGYDRKWNSSGQVRPIQEIWWHLPLTYAAFVILSLLFMPRGIRRDRES